MGEAGATGAPQPAAAAAKQTVRRSLRCLPPLGCRCCLQLPCAATLNCIPQHPSPHTTNTQARPAWDRQLDAYTRGGSGGGDATPPAARAARTRLADAVRAAPESPEAWWALLASEEAAGGGTTASLGGRGGGRGGVTLLDLYSAATQTVPRQPNYANEAYLRLWLGFARQQWCVVGRSCRAGTANDTLRQPACPAPAEAACR